MARGSADRPNQGTAWFSGWGGGWDGFSSSFGGADRTMMGMASPSAGLLDRLVSQVRSRLLDRRLTVRTQHGEVALTLTDLDLSLDTAAVSVGQLDDVTLTAEDVRWRDVQFGRVVATLRNTYLRAGKSPALVGAPVELRLSLTEEQLAGLATRWRPQLVVGVTPEATGTVSWRPHEARAHLEVTAASEGTRIRVKPSALVVGGRRMALGRRVPSASFRLPVPADRVTIQAVEPHPGSIDLLVRLDQVQLPVPSGGMEEVVQRLGKLGGLLDFSRWSF